MWPAGQNHRGAAFHGDSLLWPPHRTQTWGLLQWPLLHTRHIHAFNRCGGRKSLVLIFCFGLLCSDFVFMGKKTKSFLMQETLLSVATWLESHPKEIVILACSHFEGMNERLHQCFIFSLERMFGSKLCPQTVSYHVMQQIELSEIIVEWWFSRPLWPLQESNLTLRHLWASGYQVILSYESQEAVGYKQLWAEIPYWWANKRTAEGVISYMDCKKASGRPGYTWFTP